MAEVAALASAIAWPLLVAGGLIWLRADVRRVLTAVLSRVESGDSFEAGTSGIKLTALPQKAAAEVNAPHAAEQLEQDGFPHSLYLLHKAQRDPKHDKEELEYYRLHIWIDGDDVDELTDVARVIYHLHPDFKEPTRIVTSPPGEFSLTTIAWGQFMLSATVEFRSSRRPLRLERYLNF